MIHNPMSPAAATRPRVGRRGIAATLVACLLAGPAAADSLMMPSPVPRTGPVTASYHLDQPATGRFTLLTVWTDSAGRLVMQQATPQTLDHADSIPVVLDLRRAVAMNNHLQLRLIRDDGTTVGTAAAAFVASPPDQGWTDYPIIIWQDQSPARAAGLRRLGINAGRVTGIRSGPLTAEQVRDVARPRVEADLSLYVENIATDFYSAYHRFQPDHPVTWAFDQVQDLARRDPTDPAVFQRQPSLSDPVALETIRTRLRQHVRLFGPYHPLYYSLGDETAIADLAAAWDFDIGPASLTAMRGWLRLRYGSLAALNAQWGSSFTDWQAVMPMTTTEAIRGGADNVSAWSDFKEWMDVAFSTAVRAGTDAIHEADPTALAAIEGAQIPGWGGYDYTRLAHSVDLMEIYDFGNNVEIARALNPNLVILTTTAGDGPSEAARLWHELMLGNRGLIVWDEADALVDDAGRPSALGVSTGALFAALRDGPAAQLGVSAPAPDPVAILYSPPSFRLSWLLDRRADTKDWMARGSEIEGQDSPLRTSVARAAAWLSHSGLQPRWLSEDTLEGALRSGTRVLLLPHAIALSPEAVASIRSFVRDGGLVLADAAPGQYDARGRRRDALPLQDVVTLAPGWPADAAMAQRLHVAGLTLTLTPTRADGTPASDIDMRVLRNGTVTLVGLQRDGTAGDAEDVMVTLAQPGQVYDLRRHTNLGWGGRFTLAVGAAEPVLLAIAPALLPALALSGPATAPAGTDIVLQIALAAPSPAAAQALHVETLGPRGEVIQPYSGTLIYHGTPLSWRVPLAINDPPGRWTIRVSDRLGDAVATWPLEVTACPPLACPALPH